MYLKPPPSSQRLIVGSSQNRRQTRTDCCPVFSSSSPSLIQTYSIVGRLISVAADNQAASELFDRQLSGWHFTHADCDGKLDATIHVFDATRPDLPGTLDSFALPSGGRCYTDWTT